MLCELFSISQYFAVELYDIFKNPKKYGFCFLKGTPSITMSLDGRQIMYIVAVQQADMVSP